MHNTYKEGQRVYVAVNGIAEECIISATGLGENTNRCLLYYGHDNNRAIIATPDEFFEDEETCQVAYAQSQLDEYQKYYEELSNVDELLAKLMYMVKNNCKAGEMEFAAMMERASEITGMNFHEYLKKYTDDIENEESSGKKKFKDESNVA